MRIAYILPHKSGRRRRREGGELCTRQVLNHSGARRQAIFGIPDDCHIPWRRVSKSQDIARFDIWFATVRIAYILTHRSPPALSGPLMLNCRA